MSPWRALLTELLHEAWWVGFILFWGLVVIAALALLFQLPIRWR